MAKKTQSSPAVTGRYRSRRKVRAASLSVASNITLVAGKCAVAFLTGSVSVLSEAVHSSIDLLAALIALFAVRFAAHPADEDHPYGHGKIENVSGTVEAILIFLAAGIIIHEAVDRIRHPGSVSMAALGAGVMGASALINTFVAAHLQRVARQTESAALAADAAHLRTDVYTSLASMAGLAVVALTGMQVLDPAIALLIALVILWEAWMVVTHSFRDLLDVSLPAGETSVIRAVLDNHRDRFQDWHALRTRKSGSERKIDLHLTLCGDESVEGSHALCDEIEKEIEERLPGVDITIHVEPCERPGGECVDGPCQAVSLPLHVIRDILERWGERSVQYRDLHVHRGGREPQIDVSLVVPKGMNVTEAHKLCDEIEKEIRQALPRFRPMIHVEPVG
jgi:cation diffusion facilitator family transporter